jgi:serine/threonine protein kinase
VCKLKISLDGKGADRLKRESDILSSLRDRDQSQSSQFVSQCLYHGLVSSSGPSSPSQSLIQVNGSVFESGGPNLREFHESCGPSIDVTQRIHILREIVRALDFLHDHRIVHGDLKPESVMSFSSLETGMVRWKIGDFENSFDESSPPALELPNDFIFTAQYAAPERVQLWDSNARDGSSSASSSSPRLLSGLPARYEMDIWSLGMVSVWLLSGSSPWGLLFPEQPFSLAMLKTWDDRSLERLMSFFSERQSGLIHDCLRTRSSCHSLLESRLFH